MHSGVRPDIMVIAKGIANGFPLSGIVSTRELMNKMPKGSLGGTYTGNAVSCAAGVECANIMTEENILDNVNERFDNFLKIKILKQLTSNIDQNNYLIV